MQFQVEIRFGDIGNRLDCSTVEDSIHYLVINHESEQNQQHLLSCALGHFMGLAHF
jgi:hypothetical protein